MKKLLVILAATILVALPLTAQTTYTAIAGSTFFTAADATKTQTATAFIPNRSANGNLMVTTTGVTGSPSGCTLAMYSLGSNSSTAPAAAEQTPSITITTGTHAQVVAALSAADISTDQIKAVYACSTYPTAGTITISFAPLSTIATGALTISTPAQVQNYNSGSLTVTPSDGTNPIGALVNYGSTPTAVKALSTNTYITNTVAGNIAQVSGATQSATNPLFTSITDGTSALGTMVAYGSTPTAVKALSTNTYITNTPTVTVSTSGDPCLNPNIVKSSVVVNTSGGGTTQLVALNGAKLVYVCNLSAGISATTATLALEYGTGASCGTGTTALTGTIVPTAGMWLSLGWGGTVVTAPAGNALCIVNGGTGTQIGVLTYVQQ